MTSFPTLRIKRRTDGPGSPTVLAHGELAFNESEEILYYGAVNKQGSDKAGSAIKIGGAGAFVSLEGDQTIGGIKTFSSIVIDGGTF